MIPLKVGITGGIGSGKSIVSRILKTMGHPVFDADQTAKDLYLEKHIKISVMEVLGELSYLENGQPNKKYIAEQIFNNPVLLQSINNILHPEVNRRFFDWVNLNTGANIVFKEAAIMFESGSNKTVDLVVGILANESIRISRVMNRDSKSESEIRKIMMHQMKENELARICDYTIINDDSLPLMPQILKLLEKLKSSNKIH
jgi:dephospho-CoA kinase